MLGTIVDMLIAGSALLLALGLWAKVKDLQRRLTNVETNAIKARYTRGE